MSRRTSRHPSPHPFGYGALTLSGRLSHAARLKCGFVTVLVSGSSAFARHYWRNRSYFLFLRVLRYFSSPRFPSISGYHVFHVVGSPIRSPTDRRALTAPRGVSPLVASFVGSWCQGIHCVPFFP